MELHSNFTNIRLLKKLDRELGMLREDDPSSDFSGQHYKNWLVPVAIQRGLYGFLCQETGQVRALINGWKTVIKRPLLDLALRPMDYQSQRDSIINPDPRVVSLLLENGADPNESCRQTATWKDLADQFGLSGRISEGAPIWKKFMDDENFMEDQFGLSPHRKKVEIIKMLFIHGAKFTIRDKNGHVVKKLSSFFTSQEVAHLKSTFGTIRGKRQRSDSTASQDYPSKRTSRAAIETLDSRPDPWDHRPFLSEEVRNSP